MNLWKWALLGYGGYVLWSAWQTKSKAAEAFVYKDADGANYDIDTQAEAHDRLKQMSDAFAKEMIGKGIHNIKLTTIWARKFDRHGVNEIPGDLTYFVGYLVTYEHDGRYFQRKFIRPDGATVREISAQEASGLLVKGA